MGGIMLHVAVTNLKHRTFYTVMENYFPSCKKIHTRPRFSHSSQSTNACWPLSGEAVEEYTLPGVNILRCNWELGPLCLLTPVAN